MGASDNPSALAQYDNATRIEENELSGGVALAWTLDAGEEVHGYAWQDPKSPEVLVVAVSTAHTCGFYQMVEQVGVKRVE